MDATFDNLVANAFDFFNKSIGEVEKNPKFSLINFFTAVELIFKARLMHEHWSLIFAKPENASKDKFESGDFTSVAPKDLLNRLENITGESFSKSEIACYDFVRTHRNMTIHFYNTNFTSPKSIESVVVQELHLWYYLHKRLIGTWQPIFKDHDQTIEAVQWRMINTRKFLDTKFNLIVGDIENKKTTGKVFNKCSICGFESAEITREISSIHGDHLVLSRCMVCERGNTAFYFQCPSCSALCEFQDTESFCECGKNINIHDIVKKYRYYDRDSGEDSLYYCSYCEHYEKSVAKFDEVYLCFNCMETHDDFETCEWCNSPIAGFDSEGSHHMGCFMCDGWDGWHGDKD